MNFISSYLIDTLNAIGLPILTAAIILMYRAFLKRTSFLQSSMKDMKIVYDSVIETAKKRSVELEASLDNQKSFNELYLKMVADSQEHAEKINEWRKSEVVLLEERIRCISKELESANDKIVFLKSENLNLHKDIDILKKEVADLKDNNMGPGESMARSNK